MKRIEMFSTVCLDTSCYSTWNYFSQGSCHITHKVPVEQQHGSTELVQCTHKEDHFYPPSLARTTLAQGLPEESGFLVGWVVFFFLFWLLLWHCTSVSWGPRHSIQQFQQKELQGESLLRGCSGTALSILSLSTSFFTIFFPFISRYKPQDRNSGPDHIRHAEDKQFKQLQPVSGLLSGRCLKVGLNKELS